MANERERRVYTCPCGDLDKMEFEAFMEALANHECPEFDKP